MNLRYLIPMIVLVVLCTTGAGVSAQEYGSAFFYSPAHDQNQCSFDFSSKEYGTESDGEFYFTDGKFFANNLGQRGLIDLGAIQFDPADIEIPATGYDQFGVEPIPQHVYISLSRAGNDNRYILFTVNYLTLEGNAVSLEYYTLDTGTIIVNTNMAAGFEIIGPRTFSGSGDYWKGERILAGEYTILYKDLPGFETPSSQTKILNPGGTIVFEGQYNPVVNPDTGTIIVNTNMATGFEITGPRTFSGSGDSWKEEQIMTGEYTIRYNDLPRFETPSSQTKILNPGSTIVFEGQYNPEMTSPPTTPTTQSTPSHDNEPEPSPPFTISDTVLVAIIGTIGSIIAAYFGYKAVVKSRK